MDTKTSNGRGLVPQNISVKHKPVIIGTMMKRYKEYCYSSVIVFEELLYIRNLLSVKQLSLGGGSSSPL